HRHAHPAPLIILRVSSFVLFFFLGRSNNSFGSPPFSLPVSKERNPEAKLQ
uniref:Uncharacterized protein n=1 Tax=Aegilops tauschii subsp. strangulata TaxID=200361 RepID=A0A453JRP8_AEGTS